MKAFGRKERGKGVVESERQNEHESFPSIRCLCFLNNTEWRYAEYKHRNWRAVRMPVVDGSCSIHICLPHTCVSFKTVEVAAEEIMIYRQCKIRTSNVH